MKLHILAMICFLVSFLLYLSAAPLGVLVFVCAVVLELIAWGLLFATGFGREKNNGSG